MKEREREREGERESQTDRQTDKRYRDRYTGRQTETATLVINKTLLTRMKYLTAVIYDFIEIWYRITYDDLHTDLRYESMRKDLCFDWITSIIKKNISAQIKFMNNSRNCPFDERRNCRECFCSTTSSYIYIFISFIYVTSGPYAGSGFPTPASDDYYIKSILSINTSFEYCYTVGQ